MMAEAAKQTNQITQEQLDDWLDRYSGFEDEVESIMGAARNKCKTPREGQKDIRTEVKEAGLNAKVFEAMWRKHNFERREERRADELDDDAREKMVESAQSIGGPMGAWMMEKLDQPTFN